MDPGGRSPVGFYTLALLGALALTGILHGLLVVALPLLDPSGLTQPLLTGLFAIVYSWALSGLAVGILLGAWHRSRFLGLVLFMGLAAGWVLGLRRHIPYSSTLLYLAPLGLGGLVLYAGLRYGAAQLLPTPERSQSKDAFGLLRAQLGGSGRPGIIVDPGPQVAAEARPLPGRALERPLDKPSLVITPAHKIVAVSDRLQLKGVRGPGLVLLRPGERVDQIIDLRPQERSFELVGHTLDGIGVRVRASVAFQIDAGRRRPKLGSSMPFSRAAAFKAVHAQRVEHAAGTGSDKEAGPQRGAGLDTRARRRLWDDLPGVRGEHSLRDIVSRMRFDELYAPHSAEGKSPRSAVARQLSDELRVWLKQIGIQLIDVELGNFEPIDPEVYVKRARSWQARWIRDVEPTQAEGSGEELNILNRARADARTELVLDLGRELEPLAESETELGPEVVLRQLLRVLKAFTARAELSQALPSHSREVLRDVREAVED